MAAGRNPPSPGAATDPFFALSRSGSGGSSILLRPSQRCWLR